MLRPVEMCKVNILVHEKHVGELTRRLGALGVVHLVDAVTQSPGKLLSPIKNSNAAMVHRLADKCQQLMRQLDITGGNTPAKDADELPYDDIAQKLDALSQDYDKKNRELTDLLVDINTLKQQGNEDNATVLTDLKAKAKACRAEIRAMASENAAVLRTMKAQLLGSEAIQDAQAHFGSAKHLVCISGWAPASDASAIEKTVDETTDGTGITEIIPAALDSRVAKGKEQVPTKMVDNAFTRPFQSLVTNFGIPSYNEIDPTLFFGITFVLLFGYMFGDIGHGLVLILAGLFGRFTKKKLDSTIRESSMILVFCGLCSMVFGTAYGSIFGYEHLFEALWVNPMKSSDIMTLLMTAIGVGTVFTSIALIFNIINHIRARKYFDGTMERFGIVGLVFFWFCLGIGLWLMSGHDFATWMLIPILAPLVLIFLKHPLHCLINRHPLFKDGGVFGVILECGIEVLETLTGYFSGTVSFVRVGAFAISHAALCFAVFTLMSMLDGVPCGGIVKVLIFIGGNILIIVFEGMVDMIQCVRLEYYELFGKYFSGGGIAYSPFTLKRNNNDN